MINKIIGTIKLVQNVQYTDNLFDKIAVLNGKSLDLLEEGRDGSCLCMCDGKYLVDVDKRDIESKTFFKATNDFFGILKEIVALSKK